MLSLEEIAAKRYAKRQIVFVEELNENVLLSVMTGADWGTFQDEIVKANVGTRESQQLLRAHLLVRCMVDEIGSRRFTDEQAVELNSILSWKSIAALAEVASEINKTTDAAMEKEKGNS